jgi:acetyl esterase/lipase
MMAKNKRLSVVTACAIFFGGISGCTDDSPASEPGTTRVATYAPPHLGPEWRQLFENYQPAWDIPDPEDLDGWRAWDAAKQGTYLKRDSTLAEEHEVELRDAAVNGVRVVVITPRKLKHEDKGLMYMHGGAWASHSPESTFTDTIPMAAELGVRVFSVDYTKAPFASIYEIIDENISVFEHLVEDHEFAPQDIGLFGCSAGGHLSLAVSNALRIRKDMLPGAIVAGSPMIDFTLTNDTWITLEGQDPAIAREAYVRKVLPILGIENYRDPVISPNLDPDLNKGMPPTLIQTGGKEVLLSDSLVMYQALESAGQIAKLDVYDGMPHCFPYIYPDSKEGKAAIAKQVAWFQEYLDL